MPGDGKYDEFSEFFDNNAVPTDAAPPVDFEIVDPDAPSEDEEYGEDYDEDYGGPGPDAGGAPPFMGGGGGNGQPAFAPTIMDRYDSDSLNYLRESVTDDLAKDLITKVANAQLTPDCKMDIASLIITFSSREYVITGYESSQEMRKRWLEFRDAFSKLKSKTRLVNKTNGELTFILSLLEGHFNNKLTRSRKGFERKAQLTQHISQTNTTEYPEEEPRSGIRRFFGHGGR